MLITSSTIAPIVLNTLFAFLHIFLCCLSFNGSTIIPTTAPITTPAAIAPIAPLVLNSFHSFHQIYIYYIFEMKNLIRNIYVLSPFFSILTRIISSPIPSILSQGIRICFDFSFINEFCFSGT